MRSICRLSHPLDALLHLRLPALFHADPPLGFLPSEVFPSWLPTQPLDLVIPSCSYKSTFYPRRFFDTLKERLALHLRVRQNSNRVALPQHRCFDLSRLRVSDLGVSHPNATLGALLTSTLHAYALQTSTRSSLRVVMLHPSTSLNSLCLHTPSCVLSSASSLRAPNFDLSATFHTSLLKFRMAASSNTEMLESTTDLARIAHTPDAHSLSSLRLRAPFSTNFFLTHSHASSFDRHCFHTVRQRQLHFRSANFLAKRYFTLNGSITVTFTSPPPPSRST